MFILFIGVRAFQRTRLVFHRAAFERFLWLDIRARALSHILSLRIRRKVRTHTIIALLVYGGRNWIR